MKNQPHQQQLAAMMMKTKKRINEKKKKKKNKSNTNQIENENEEAKHFGIDTVRETRRIYATRYLTCRNLRSRYTRTCKLRNEARCQIQQTTF